MVPEGTDPSLLYFLGNLLQPEKEDSFIQMFYEFRNINLRNELLLDINFLTVQFV